MINPETLPVIQGKAPCLDASVDTCDYISLKNAQGVLITTMFGYIAGANLVLTVLEATDVTPTGSQAITTGAEFQIWINTDTASSDVMVRQTDALTYTILHAGTKNQIVVFYIDASILSVGYSCVALHTTTGGTSMASVLYQLVGARYQQEAPLTAIA